MDVAIGPQERPGASIGLFIGSRSSSKHSSRSLGNPMIGDGGSVYAMDVATPLVCTFNQSSTNTH